jgi:hypothetical protein
MIEVTMTKEKISASLKKELDQFLKGKRRPELITTYLFYLSKKFDISPVVSPPFKTIYKSLEEALKLLEREGKLYRETKIRIGQEKASVNEQTAKVYICPHSGKVFADNTHPNPQDAIYDWVSKCPENQEYKDGLKVKRFFVSTDPKIIQNYITERDEPVTKVVFSSTVTGSLFSSKEDVVEDFKKNYLKPISLLDIQNQNRFQLEEHFLNFFQAELSEDKITAFVEAVAGYEEFQPYVAAWLED